VGLGGVSDLDWSSIFHIDNNDDVDTWGNENNLKWDKSINKKED
jgi:hypothetical protein